MGIWVHFVTFIGVAIVITCEAKSPKRPIDDSTDDDNEGILDKYPICGVNEVYDICPRLCPPRRCDVDERIIRCGENPKPGDPKCKAGCRCADNYYRNNDGVCVNKDECPKCFQKNEVYACRSSNPQTCEAIDEDYEPIKNKKRCKRECRCKDGFYRNKIGECISKKNCLKCNGPHEYFSCGSACDNVCDTIHLQNQTNCPIINIKCNPKCYCEYGYARDNNNICVPIAECPPKCNRPNEVYECQSPCPQTCENIGEKCLSKQTSKRHCKRECRCKKGYYRNKLGDCISKKNCLKCSGPNEFFSCGGACDNVCSTLNEQNQTNCPIVNIVCNQMCYCEEGYARDENNICVPIEDCPPTCPVNEVYDICPRLCPPRRCDVDERLIRCAKNPKPGDPKCKPGCRCADNYYRNNDGVCVTKNNCPKCKRKNEVYACRSSNPQTCETIDEDYGPVKQTKHCKRQCRCKAGYYKNKIGECISKKNCLKCNGPHEYFTCGSACDNVCATLQSQNQTNCPIINKTCNKKCYCEEGYARDENNICIPIEECPAVCGINEVYDICPPVCPPLRCDVNIAAISCKPSPKPGDPECNPGCRCEDNHVRNEVGICIPRDECPPEPTCGDNEELSECANGGCRRWKCSDEGITCTDLREVSCVKGCVCKDSYVRDDNGICIPKDKCPVEPIQCGLNEQYSACANGGCRRFTCAMGGILCVDLIEGGCKPGCICEASYTRADNGTCIPEDQCPPTCGVNEVYDVCPALCPPGTCDVDERTIDCAPNPVPGDPECNPGCRCAENFYRNDVGLCVTREECPPLIVCDTNEIASRCANGGCRKLSCAVPQTVCAKIPIGFCKEGCVCKENYLRADNGTCILEKECPPVCGLHEIYDDCPPTCPPQRCDVDNRLIKCKRTPTPGDPECKPGCRCEDNYYKNDLGLCVTRDECPPLIKCGTNEVASKCANGGCRKRSCARPQLICAKLPSSACKEGCICKNNYLRSSNGTCISENECPPVCGLHEVYDECPPTCPPQRCDIDNRLIKCKRTPTPGDPECKPGCRCEDNFYRNNEGACVTRDECPPLIQCGENEFPSSCANGGCRKVSCARPQIRCVKLKEGGCEEGCLCNDNYLRAENGTCIPEEECPPVCGINEVYDVCPPICPQQRCDVDIALILCKPNPKPGDPECNPGCRCADNYFKNSEGVCVPRDKCPPPINCELNEVYSTCANGGCRRYSCNTTAILCIDLVEGACKPGCICRDNYTRSDDGICIPENQCPKICGPNEEYGCDNTCSKTCKTVNGKCVPPIKSKICKLQCHCKDGYKKNKKGECVSECDGVTEKITDGLTAFEQGNIDFTEQFLITASKNNPNESVIGSPFSVLFLLAQLALYATGQAKTQLLNLLHLSNDCEIRTSVPKYFKLISETNNASFDLAQKIYGTDKYPFSKNFKEDSKDVFNAQAENVNFAKSQEAANIINKWVAKQTRNLIKDLVSPDTLSADTRLVLAIAIYFNGDWKRQFKARNTKLLPFYTGKTNDEVQVKMMNQVGTFKYAEIDGVQVLQMPYTVPDISFVACLPKSKTGVKKLINKLKKSSFIKRTLSELKSTKVDVSIPTLDISTTTDLKQVLSDAGVQAIFDPSTAGLSGILENPEDIFVTSAVQKAKLLLNETGTQAAAATVKCNGPHEYFTCGSACDNVCATLQSQNQTNCPIINRTCNKKCYCEEGYARDENNICIPIEECPVPEPTCGDNEEFSKCANGGCRRWKCSDEGNICYDVSEEACVKDCVCIDSYVRDDNGICIPQDQCPPPLIQCGENEFPSSCANGGCRKVSCARPQIRCVKLKEGGCKEGCLCKDNYLRAENGTCIPEEECPPVCGINEIYDVCPPICPQQRCDVDIALILCKPNPKPGDPECNPGCRCADNYFKNSEGFCVPRDKCPPPINCELNEVYSTCANGGCRRYSCNTTAILCIDLVEGACKPGCICRDNYTRSDDGICIPENQCPKICGPNEEYGCDNTCSKTCKTVNGKCVPPIKSKICKLQCHCKDGYKKNKKRECVSECDGVTEKITDGLTAFELGNIDFTEQFLITAFKNNPGESVIGSPFSVLFLLAQLALFATGQAKTQLLNLLHLSNDCEIRTSVPKYFKLISETNNASFDLAQKIYGTDQYPFSKNFKEDSKDVFNAQAENVNFAKSQEAADIINKWVAKQTRNLIKDLVSPDTLSTDTRLVLAIAIYFNGDWKRQFKARNTKFLPFYTGKTNDEVQVKMMNQVGTFKYAEIDGVQVLQMPYTVPDISFVACLPKSKTGVKKLINKLKKSSFIKRTLSELKSTKVDVSIPTLDISTTTDLKQVLSDAGVQAIFDPSTAGLSGILENPEDIFVTSAVQKAKLLLNETGTQAAAATAVVVGVRSLPIVELDPIRFNADHPFIYYIVLKNCLVFAGVYAGPQ